MTLHKVGPDAARATRDEVQRRIERALSSALRDYLGAIEQSTLSGVMAATPYASVTAAAVPAGGEVPSLGTMAGRWAAGVDAEVVSAVAAAFDHVWSRYTTAGVIVDSPAERAMRAYIAAVRDRLVQGTHFGVPVYEESFDAVRRALAASQAEGWSRPQLAQRIAAELAWETDGDYWRGVQREADEAIDAILDPLGEPGTPAREYARHNDPRVLSLRETRNAAIRHLDAERSVWQTRASLIARTESTGVANYGAQQAFIAEGAERKMWLAASGGRTRPTHAAASDQVVRLDSPFIVGGAAMQFPGDPNGPVEEVANCRCTMVNPDNL